MTQRSKLATRTDWFVILGFLIPVVLVAVTSVLLPWIARWTHVVLIGSAALVVLILGSVLVVLSLSPPEDRSLRVAVLLFSLPLPLYVIGGVLPASRRHYDILIILIAIVMQWLTRWLAMKELGRAPTRNLQAS